jgi:hypothetical protein
MTSKIGFNAAIIVSGARDQGDASGDPSASSPDSGHEFIFGW